MLFCQNVFRAIDGFLRVLESSETIASAQFSELGICWGCCGFPVFFVFGTSSMSCSSSTSLWALQLGCKALLLDLFWYVTLSEICVEFSGTLVLLLLSWVRDVACCIPEEMIDAFFCCQPPRRLNTFVLFWLAVSQERHRTSWIVKLV